MNAGLIEAGQIIKIDGTEAKVVSNDMILGEFGFFTRIIAQLNGQEITLEIQPHKLVEVA
jgi:hypothetical protein